MDLTGEYRIAAPRDAVWAGLNDPAILQACIPGCETLEKTADNEFKATVRIKIGPVSARFGGKVTLTDLDPPNGYRIVGEGSGGAAGFAKGGATVNLTREGSETILRYKADAQVGGKLAQVGSRLIEGTSNKLAGEFFSAFAEKVAAGAAPPVGDPMPASVSAAVNPVGPLTTSAAAVAGPSPTPPRPVGPQPAQPSTGWRAWMLVIGVLAVAAIAYLVAR
ncbi:MAG: carbon monoxide dehydrogenase subunit G [Rhodospirillales bacterium]